MKKEKGFSTLEVMMVVVLISLFAMIIVSNFSQARYKLALSRVAYKFDQDVRKAQNLAASAVPYADGSGTAQEVLGYGVYVNITTLGSKQYLIYADKPNGSTTVNGITYSTSNQIWDEADYTVQTIDFSAQEPGIFIKEVVHALVGDRVSFNFNISDLFANIYRTQTAETPAIDVIFALESDPNTTRTVSVNYSGGTVIK